MGMLAVTNGFVMLPREFELLDNPELFTFWAWCHMNAAYQEKDVIVKGDIIHINQGQFIMTYSKTSEQFRVSTWKVGKYIKTLTKINKISQKPTRTYTIITVLDYVTYENDIENDQTQTKRKPNANQTQTKRAREEEYKNINKSYILRTREEPFVPVPANNFMQRFTNAAHTATVREVIEYLNEKTGVHISPDPHVNHSTCHLFDRLRDGRTVEQLKAVIDKKASDRFFQDNKRFYNLKTLFDEPNFSRYMDEQTESEATNETEPAHAGIEAKKIVVDLKSFEQDHPEWKAALDKIKARVRPEILEHAYAAFIDPLVAVNVTDDVVRLYSVDAPWVREHYGVDIQKHMKKRLVITDELPTVEVSL